MIAIGDWAFDSCTSLTSVTIPNSVIGIGTGAFDGCTSLTSVTFANGSNISSASFYNDAFGLIGLGGYIGDLRDKYLAAGGGAGTYTRASGGTVWTKL